MKQIVSSLTIATLISLGATVAAAECYADYKAKKDNPLRLHYGVVQLPNPACRDRNRAVALISKRIAVGGWQLLNVMSVFGPEGLDSRRNSAGQFFLKF